MKRSKHNPARSAAQYGMAQAVLSGQSTALPKKVAREMVDSTPARLRAEYARELAEIRRQRGNPDPETILLSMAREAGRAYAEQAAPHAHLERGFADWVDSYQGAMLDLDFEERAKLLLAFGEGINQVARPNPGATSAGQWTSAVLSLKGQGPMTLSQARDLVRATPHHRRSEFASEIWRLRRRHGTAKRAEVPF